MPSNLPRRLARSIAAATLASVAAGGLAHDNDRDRHRLPQLSPAKPAALIGACEDLAARLGGFAEHGDHRQRHDCRRHARRWPDNRSPNTAASRAGRMSM